MMMGLVSRLSLFNKTLMLKVGSKDFFIC